MKWSENGGGEMEGGRREKARERCKQGDIGKQGRRAAFESSAKSAFQPSILPRARGFLEPPRAFENGSRKHLAARSRARARRQSKTFVPRPPSRHLLLLSRASIFVHVLVRRISDSFFEKNGMEWSGRREKNKITRLILEELGRGGGGRSSLRRDEKSFSAGGEEAQEEAKATGN